MSGHSKWATIKHKKGAADAKRGKVFSRLAKEIMVVAREGGGDPGQNITLRTLLQKAKGVNMPNDNIERAIKKGTGELDGGQLDEIVYEGYAGGGVALVVKVLTDNKNRAAAEVRHIFTRHGSSFAGQGSVTRSFERKGQILVDAESIDEDKLMEIALEAGADDIKQDGPHFEVLTDPADFAGVMDALEAAEVATIESGVSLVPTITVPVTEKSSASSILRFISELEDNDDVQNVYSNMDLTDEVLAELEADE